jgi:hypothetical protein
MSGHHIYPPESRQISAPHGLGSSVDCMPQAAKENILRTWNKMGTDESCRRFDGPVGGIVG